MYRLIILAALTLSVNIFAAGNEAAFLKFQKKAVLEKQIPGCNVYNIPLDSEIYKSASPGQSDIRVTNSEGEIVPFEIAKLVCQREESRNVRRSSTICSMKKNDTDNCIEIILENKSPEKEISGLKINSSDKNFEKNITVFSGNDRKNWALNIENVKIFDYSRIVDLASNEVKIVPVKAKYFKVVIGNFTENEESSISTRTRIFENGEMSSESVKNNELRRIIHIDNVEIFGTESKTYDSQIQFSDYPVSIKIIENKNKETEITVKTNKQPLTSFTLSTDTSSFVRYATLEVRQNDNSYARIGSAKIFSVNTPNGKKSMTKLDFGETKNGEYRITISNAENHPLENIRIKARGPQYVVRLLSDSGPSPFNICYGGELETPDYDVKDVLGMQDKQVPAYFRLGKEEINPDYRKAPFADSGWLGKYLFYGGILTMIAGLGTPLAFYIKKIEAGNE